jgi:hypothetical protein
LTTRWACRPFQLLSSVEHGQLRLGEATQVKIGYATEGEDQTNLVDGRLGLGYPIDCERRVEWGRLQWRGKLRQFSLLKKVDQAIKIYPKQEWLCSAGTYY